MSYFIKPNSSTKPLWESQTDNMMELAIQQDLPQSDELNEWNTFQSNNNVQFYGYDGLPPELVRQRLIYAKEDNRGPGKVQQPTYPGRHPEPPHGKMGYAGPRRGHGHGHNPGSAHGYNPAPHRNWWMRYRWHRMPAIRRPAVDYATNHWIPPYEIPLEVYNYPGYEIVEYPVPRVRYYWPIR